MPAVGYGTYMRKDEYDIKSAVTTALKVRHRDNKGLDLVQWASGQQTSRGGAHMALPSDLKPLN